LVDGRNFTNKLISDTANVLINQSAAQWLGWDDPAVKKLTRVDGEDYTIVRVVNDFNFESLKQSIEPLMHCIEKKNALDIGH
jgi:putative ABC transport system permease protein